MEEMGSKMDASSFFGQTWVNWGSQNGGSNPISRFTPSSKIGVAQEKHV